ncbi:MAG: PqqD family peptide modification chaperone [Anaerolineae bacterium]|nr:PqqD family peptide modification chaperone [Anaerolineae bacterium]MEB2287008.1 PqqD family protein [Anaerolineae bacterium]
MRYLQNPDIVVREEPGEVWLFFDPDTNQRRYSNAVGASVWELCDGTRDLAQIVVEVCAAFEGAPSDQVGADVRELLQNMEADHFIVRAD